METSRSPKLRSWIGLGILLVALGGLLLLGKALDRLPNARVVPGLATLRGSQRRVVESLSVVPSELGGPGRPGFSPPPGIYERTLRVELRPDDRRGVVMFTTDGSLPTAEHGAIYRRPVVLDVRQPGVTVIRAIQLLDGIASPDVTAVYAVGLDSALPIVSIAVEPDDLWGVEKGVLANPSFRGTEWERPVQVTFLSGEEGFAIPAGLRVDGAESLNAPKQSLRLYFRSEYGAARLEYPLFAEHPQQPEVAQSYDRLLLQAGDRNGWWTLFRDELVAESARALGLPTAQSRFVHLFLNGESWGQYRLSERVDRFFLGQNFGYRDVDVVQEGRAQEGSDEDWDALIDWVSQADLSQDEAYSSVRRRLDLAAFTDFAVLQLYSGFSAEDVYAVRERGGCWSFVYGGGAQAFAQRPEAIPAALGSERADFAVLLRALLSNAEFRSGLRERASLLLNTVLSPEAMEERVAALESMLSADIRYEEARWPAPTRWADNVASLHSFVAGRPAALRAILGERLGLGAAVTVALRVDPPGAGAVYAGGLALPGSVVLHVGTAVELMAVPSPGFVVDGWAGAGAASDSAALTWTVDGPREIVVRFRSIDSDAPGLYPDDVVINEFWINDNGTRYRSLGHGPLMGDWVELWVQRPATVDMRGWRLTDNDTKDGTDEGSIIFPPLDAFAEIPRGTAILLIVTESADNAMAYPEDDLDPSDGTMALYVGNGNLDVHTDPGFSIGTRDEALVLLAPGPDGEVGIDFVGEGSAVTPYSFGVLQDGVSFRNPLRYLGADDGAVFTGAGSNDDGALSWLDDPTACESGDELCLDAVNVLTPGKANAGQRWALWWGRLWERCFE